MVYRTPIIVRQIKFLIGLKFGVSKICEYLELSPHYLRRLQNKYDIRIKRWYCPPECSNEDDIKKRLEELIYYPGDVEISPHNKVQEVIINCIKRNGGAAAVKDMYRDLDLGYKDIALVIRKFHELMRFKITKVGLTQPRTKIFDLFPHGYYYYYKALDAVKFLIQHTTQHITNFSKYDLARARTTLRYADIEDAIREDYFNMLLWRKFWNNGHK